MGWFLWCLITRSAVSRCTFFKMADNYSDSRRRKSTMVVEKWSKPAQLVLRGKESSFGTTKLCICWKSFQQHEQFLYQPTRCSPRAAVEASVMLCHSQNQRNKHVVWWEDVIKLSHTWMYFLLKECKATRHMRNVLLIMCVYNHVLFMSFW